jgi:hypothetical protein
MVSKHGRGRWRKSSADGVLSILAPLLPRAVGEALRSPRAALVALALTAAADVALALCLFAQLHAWRFPHGACAARARVCVRAFEAANKRTLTTGVLCCVVCACAPPRPRVARRRLRAHVRVARARVPRCC